MPDSDKAPGQAVKQEPADELNGGDRDLFGVIFSNFVNWQSVCRFQSSFFLCGRVICQEPVRQRHKSRAFFEIVRYFSI